jgi:signal transduction histidine kinase
MKLRTKMIAILVVTVIIVMSGSGLFFFMHYKSAFRGSVNQSINSIAIHDAHILEHYLEQKLNTAEHIGEMVPYLTIEYGDFDWLRDYFHRHFRKYSAFNEGFFFVDANGILKINYPSYPEQYGRDYSRYDFFKRTMAGKEGVISQPYRLERNGDEVLTVTAYVSAPNGTPLGVIGCVSSVKRDGPLQEIKNRRIGLNGYSYVFDKSRMMFLHPDESRILQRDVPIGKNKMFDAAVAGVYGTTETVNSKGVRMLSAFRPVRGTDWIVCSQIPTSEAFAPLWTSQKLFGFFVVIGSTVAALVGLFFVHRSMQGLTTLENVTDDLAIPDRCHDVDDVLIEETAKLRPLENHPEFGPLALIISKLYERLGRSLSESQLMADSLDEAYQQLKSTQFQILQQEKMASVGQLAAGVAHEINNPMGFISSNLSTLKRYQEKLTDYLQLLESCVLEEGNLQHQKEYKKKQKIDYILEDIADLIEESSDGAERVKKIVQNLKSFSRVDQSDFVLADINECLESTLAIAWNEIKYKSTLEKDFGPLPLLTCYPQQLNQVFLNILINAVQAIKNKGMIRIKTWADEQAIKISITDNGSGIPPSAKERIFEPFFTTKKVGEGTGLGMSISYEIINKHGGQILLDSAEGHGTTFTIVLPRQEEDE